ncbi:MAG: uroporphyrinogen decarboxylase family protein [Desulfobacterales bacterium]|jgi:uroporphyrinogen decarboxylase|nr:uroporphyrinogen decarboxylase family protein [Desulfobacterales bacterium]
MNLLGMMKTLKSGRLPPLGTIPDSLLDAAAGAASFRGRFRKLTSVERILTTFRHKEPDRVPVTPILCSAARQISGMTFPDYALNADKSAQSFIDGFDFVGGDLVILMLDLSVEAADFGQKMNYPDASTPHPDYSQPVIRHIDDYERIRRIDLADAPRMTEFVKLCRIVAERIGLRGIVTGFVFGPLGVLSMMRGAENMFKDCVLYPKKVISACETITGVLIDFVDAQCRTGVPAVSIDTLYASRNGLPKKLWEEIEGPFSRDISMAIKKHGVVVGIHNCGHDLYFDSQIKFMEPEVISFAHLPDDCGTRKELKRRYGDHVTLLGHVPTPLLVHGSPRDVMEECKREIEELAAGGGFILAPGCEYPPNIPLTNAIALVKAAEKFG